MIARAEDLQLLDPETVCTRSPFRILVVEDDLVHYTYCEYVLGNIYGEKLQLERAKDCKTAIEKLNTREYEVCLLDYLVEGGSAKDILSRVNFGLINTPVIVVSAFEDKSFVLDALRYGADDYVIKGHFTAAQLEQTIQYAIYRKYKELMLRRRALYDPLTGLANRHLLFDRLEEAHRYASRHDERFAVLVVDLDNLKEVNDRHGHDLGDHFIKAAAEALVSSVRASDTVARIGGDEFVAVLRNVRDRERIARICDAIRIAIAANCAAIDGMDVAAACSIGVALYPEDAGVVEDLLRLADDAMYAAKRSGGSAYKFA